MPNREITFVEAIREGTDFCLGEDPDVYVIGEGVPDPKCIFGTTKGLQEKYGPERVFDMPVSENGLTGVAIGSAIKGLRPIVIHQRIDFTLYAMDQMINNAAKWYSMFGGQSSVPLFMRCIVGRGWGQGNQHSQNLQSLYAHVPGLKVVAPSTAYNAKGLLVAGVRDNNPVVMIEHRWCQGTSSMVPEEGYEVPLGKARIARKGEDLTIVSWSYSVIEALKAAEFLAKEGVNVEVVDVQTIRPMDFETIKDSVQKTGHLLVCDASWRFGGLAGEVIASIAEDTALDLKSRPQRLTYPDFPSPSTPHLAKYYYVTVEDIFNKVGKMLDRQLNGSSASEYEKARIHDAPDRSFTGPF